ncbi:MAG: 3',5'-cyclic adenosine monophosphate phosphodiesterase CpdA [Phycisphaerales bacterium]|nr:3',5'-cyclic adenosine monophosphate phosphodiesterase CpdA [Phycisphaerales bacterium]
MNLSGSGSGFKPAPPHPPALRPLLPTPRRPFLPFPLEFVDLRHPRYPSDHPPLTILHLTDLHVRHRRGWTPSLERVSRVLAHTPVDLAVFTGDAMDHPGDEDSALTALARLVSALRTRLGVVGVFGNHDSAGFRLRADFIPGITWLRDDVLDLPGTGIRLLGPEDPEDLVGLALAHHDLGRASPRFDIALTHYPTEIYPAAQLGIPLVLAGHTHGGQIRLTRNIAPHTSTDLPGRLASGILRLNDTLCGVPRGLGEAVVNWRLHCPRQAPVYVLRHGPLADAPAPPALVRLTAW